MPSDASANTLYLIDGHAQIFRAYFAIRGGMNSPVTGESTHAVFGYAGMLIKLLDQFHPAYVVTAIDMPGKTFRDELYPEYKATRDAAPEDLGPQIQRILEMTRMFGIPIFGQEGAEADDVIATITRHILDDPTYHDVNVRIVSRDKDLEQLLSDRVTMFDIHKDETIDTAHLWEKKGLKPEQVADALALTGDKVDNIPGVDGIGPKTAAKLLQDFGTIDGIYEHIDQIKGKRRENLENARDHMSLSRQLVALKNDLELDFTMDDARVGAVDANGLQAFFEQMGFRRYGRDLERLLENGATTTAIGGGLASNTGTVSSPSSAESGLLPGEDGDGQGSLFPTSLFDAGEDARAASVEIPEGMTTAKDFTYTGVLTEGELNTLADTLRSQTIFAVDTETIGLGNDVEICGLCFAWKTGEAVYVPTRSPHQDQHMDTSTVLDTLRPILEDPDIHKCGHNIKYDALVLRHAGVDLQGITFDSMIATHMIGSPSHGMDYLAQTLLNHHTIPISRLIGAKSSKARQKTMDRVPLEDIIPYAAEDADITLRLYEDLQPKLKLLGMEELARDVEMPLVEVLTEMEHNGIRVEPRELDKQADELESRIVQHKQAILDAVGHDFNIDSPKQLADVLFTHLRLPVKKKTKTGPSTDIEVIQKLCDEPNLTGEQETVLTNLADYRQLTKLVNTYLRNLKDDIRDDGRIHASFHQTGTATGRLSSSGPNLQNIPIRTDIGRQIRKAFIAEDGCSLISADYSQIELRILAHLSKDAALIDAFNKDMDIHTAVAMQVFDVDADAVTTDQRTHAKTINFGIIYGVTSWGLARRIDNLDEPGARQLITDYKTRYKGINSFLQQCVDEADEKGFVTTMLGRRRQIKQMESRNPNQRALGERLAINSVVQGSAAELIKVAMVNLHRRIHREQLPLKILLQIHDELVLETPTEQAKAMADMVKQEMESAMELRVPLKVEAGIGEDWLNAK